VTFGHSLYVPGISDNPLHARANTQRSRVAPQDNSVMIEQDGRVLATGKTTTTLCLRARRPPLRSCRRVPPPRPYRPWPLRPPRWPMGKPAPLVTSCTIGPATPTRSMWPGWRTSRLSSSHSEHRCKLCHRKSKIQECWYWPGSEFPTPRRDRKISCNDSGAVFFRRCMGLSRLPKCGTPSSTPFSSRKDSTASTRMLSAEKGVKTRTMSSINSLSMDF